MSDQVDYEYYFALYERNLSEQKRERTRALESQVEKLKIEIEKIRGKRYLLDYDKDSVSDINDQRLIILYMCEKLPKEGRKGFVEKCPFMFVHADNVRSICKLFDFEEPTWFKEKYGHLYAKK
jgi:hypothetical protein